jgi:hypothetical protein
MYEKSKETDRANVREAPRIPAPYHRINLASQSSVHIQQQDFNTTEASGLYNYIGDACKECEINGKLCSFLYNTGSKESQTVCDQCLSTDRWECTDGRITQRKEEGDDEAVEYDSYLDVEEEQHAQPDGYSNLASQEVATLNQPCEETGKIQPSTRLIAALSHKARAGKSAPRALPLDSSRIPQPQKAPKQKSIIGHLLSTQGTPKVRRATETSTKSRAVPPAIRERRSLIIVLPVPSSARTATDSPLAKELRARKTVEDRLIRIAIPHHDEHRSALVGRLSTRWGGKEDEMHGGWMTAASTFILKATPCGNAIRLETLLKLVEQYHGTAAAVAWGEAVGQQGKISFLPVRKRSELCYRSR